MGAKDAVLERLMGNADKFSDEQVAQTLTLLVEHGVKRHASDVHIEPHEQYVLVRYRIGNILRGVHKLPRAAHAKLLEQLKTRAGLDTALTQIPQEGSYSATVDERNVEVEVSIMPVFGGEKAVLHLVPEQDKPSALEELGFWGDNLEKIQQSLTSPHGLIVVAGPKRSGKTTTLHSLLELLNTPMVSIATVEERTYRRIPGATQARVDHVHESTATLGSLHAVLRQDPNIIMLSRLPDQPTAKLAVHSALAGHMVLAGLVSDGAVTGLLHIRSLGVEPFLLATATKVVVGQRLVRKLCEHCRERYELDDTRRKKLEHALDISTDSARARVHELEQAALAAGLGGEESLGSTKTRITHLWRGSKTGCEACEHTGYQGHTALIEVLENSEHVQKSLVGTEPVTTQKLHAAALKDRFIPLALDGLIKSLRGQTTIAEVLRATT